jgi:cell division protein FtsB
MSMIADPDAPRARRRSTARQPQSRQRRPVRRLVQFGLILLGATLVVESLFGTRGLSALLEARRQHTAVSSDLERLRSENARLRSDARRLREDPEAIEEAARRDLGYIAPGEKVFIVKDVRPAPSAPQVPAQK